MVIERLFIVYFILVSFVLGIVLFSLSIFLSSKVLNIKDQYFEKYSGYECGFNPFTDSRGKFDVRFYLVGLLFIIFDLEVIFLFPWSVSVVQLGNLGFWGMIIFLILLTIGFFYEWGRGAIDWE